MGPACWVGVGDGVGDGDEWIHMVDLKKLDEMAERGEIRTSIRPRNKEYIA